MTLLTVWKSEDAQKSLANEAPPNDQFETRDMTTALAISRCPVDSTQPERFE